MVSTLPWVASAHNLRLHANIMALKMPFWWKRGLAPANSHTCGVDTLSPSGRQVAVVSGLWARRMKDWSLIAPIYHWPRRWAPHGSVDRRLWALLRHRPHQQSPPTVVYMTQGAVEAELRTAEAAFERTVCLKGQARALRAAALVVGVGALCPLASSTPNRRPRALRGAPFLCG